MIGNRECIDVSLRTEKELETMQLFSQASSYVAVVDVETTGLNPKNDEILQIAICDGDGEPLLSSYVLPERRRRWPNAQKINGITWEMVKDAPTLAELSRDIQSILGSKTLVIGYNLRFDYSMLKAGMIDVTPFAYTWDIMNDCSVMMGNWNESEGKYLYARLQTVAKHYGITYSPHDALEDAKATALVFKALVNDPKYKEKVLEKEAYLGNAIELEELRLKAESERLERSIQRTFEYLEKTPEELKAIDESYKTKNNKRMVHFFAILWAMVLIPILLFYLTFCTGHTSRHSGYRSAHEIQLVSFEK